jgi:SAM-dependent methyltransferase
MDWSQVKHATYHQIQWVRNEAYINAVADVCGTGEAVVDLGCGTGAMAGPLAQRFNRYVGVDPATNLLERCPQLPNAEYVASPLEKLTYDREFDCALLRNVVHHLPDPAVGFSQAAKALRRGGRVVLCQGVSPDSKVHDFYTKLFALFDGRHILTEGDMLAMMRMNGFRQITVQPFFMEKVNLVDWLRKVSPNEEVQQKALKMHLDGDEHFRRVYEVEGSGDELTMTWRFMVAVGIKS